MAPAVPSLTTPPPRPRHDHHQWWPIDQPLPRPHPRTMRRAARNAPGRPRRLERAGWSNGVAGHVRGVQRRHRVPHVPLRRLVRTYDRTNVAFEIDEIDPEAGIGWSVLIRGWARAVVGSYDLVNLWQMEGVEPWATGARTSSSRSRRTPSPAGPSRPPSPSDVGGARKLDRRPPISLDCRSWLGQHHQGHLGYLSGRGARSVVVTYALVGDHICYRSPSTTTSPSTRRGQRSASPSTDTSSPGWRTSREGRSTRSK